MKHLKLLRESVGASSILGKGNELLRGYSLQLKPRGLPPRDLWGDRMSQLTSFLCFCGAAVPGLDRRSATAERVCLEARLRRQLGGGPQALVVYFNLPTPNHRPFATIGAYSVISVVGCCRRCLGVSDLLNFFSYGFSRVFLELSPDIGLIRYQMDIVEAVAEDPMQAGRVALFHSETALRTLLEEDAPSGPGGPLAGALQALSPSADTLAAPTEPTPAVTRPEAQACVSLSEGCTLCGQCGWACPTGAIHLGEAGRTLEINDSLCSGCGMCASACPEQVLAIQTLAPLRRQA